MEKLKLVIPLNIYDKLLKANVNSIDFLLTSTYKELEETIGLNLTTLQYLVDQAANVVLSEENTVPASQIPAWARISTGCTSVDNITRGGIPFNGITEIYGYSGVGKTQFCIQLTLMALIQGSLLGIPCGVVYICTEDVFPIKRLVQLAECFRLRYDTTQRFEDDIYIEHLSDYEQVRRFLFNRLHLLLRVKTIRLIVIDSVAGIFRSDNQNVDYRIRSKKFLTLIRKLHELSDIYNMAVVCTNQVADNIKTGTADPCLGLSWTNLIQHRFHMIRFNESLVRSFKVVFSPDLSDKNTLFVINESGLASVI